MNIKQLSLISLLVFTSHAYATNQKLNNYEMVKNSLINGSNVKAVIDLKNDCVLVKESGDKPKTSPNIFGMLIDKFVISYKNTNIISSNHILNGSDEILSANYNIADIVISPDNKVTLELKIVLLPEYNTIKSSTYSCSINNQTNNGVKFYLF
jgi:hypothetical protein